MLKYFFLFFLLLSFSDKAFSKDNLSEKELDSYYKRLSYAKKHNRISLSRDHTYFSVITHNLYSLRGKEGYLLRDLIKLQEKAKQGDAKSQYILAKLYDYSVSDGETYDLPVDCYNSPEYYQDRLELCLHNNGTEYEKWMIKASDNGFTKAFYYKAIYHIYKHTEKDFKLAFHWAKKSLVANDKNAYHLLSVLYLNGIGTPINYKESLRLALEGAEIGDEPSQILVSMLTTNSFEAYKWALIVQNHFFHDMYQEENCGPVQEGTLIQVEEIINMLDPFLSRQQKQLARIMAHYWKPKPRNLKNKEFKLPKLAKNYSDTITQIEAPSELEKLGIGKDKYLFFRAIKEDNLEVFKLFIDANIPLNLLTEDYHYIFHDSFKENNQELFKLFREFDTFIKPKFEYLSSVYSFNVITSFYLSIFFDSKKIFDYLVKINYYGPEFERREVMNAKLNKDTPILFALSKNRIDMAKQLINAGADLSHPAIMCNAVKYNDVSLLNKLYDLGVKNIDKCDIAISNDALLVKTLCEVEDTDDFCGYEASNIPNIKDNFVANLGIPLINAVSSIDNKNLSKHCFADSTKFLLEKGANPNQLNNEIKDARESILMKAVGSENAQKCVMLLLDHKANINYRDTQGKTALYKAILIGNSQIVKILLQYGANKNDKYYLLKSDIPIRVEKPLSKIVLTSGGTMLMFAVSEGYISIVEELLKSGANPLIETKNGLTALSIAKENKNQILIDLLSEYMKKFSTNNKGN